MPGPKKTLPTDVFCVRGVRIPPGESAVPVVNAVAAATAIASIARSVGDAADDRGSWMPFISISAGGTAEGGAEVKNGGLSPTASLMFMS